MPKDNNKGKGNNMPKPNNGPDPDRTDVDVLQALSAWTEIINDGELCAVDPELATDLGVVVGDQIRVKRNNNEYALYTVHMLYDSGNDDDDIRMAQVGRERLGTTSTFNNNDVWSTTILRSDLSDQDAENDSEMVERLGDDGSHTGLIACAPHGGFIERHTDEQAERVASQLSAKNVSYWRCSGWKSGGGAFDRWHITSTNISPNSFPLLGQVANRGFTYAVSFHGYSGSDILVGGAAPTSLKEDVRDAIAAAISGSGITVRVAGPSDPVNGDSPDNFVNWLTSNGQNGVQIEQPLSARSNYGQEIADAVASVYDALL